MRLYDRFLEALTGRFTRKSDLVNALADILPLEKDNIYRRLRRDVLFTTEEIMRIAGAWNISIDNLIWSHSGKSRALRFNMIEYVDPREEDYMLLEEYNRVLAAVGNDPSGRATEVTGSLPRSLYARSELLTRFFTMKWRYKYGRYEDVLSLGEVRISERMKRLEAEYVELVHNIPRVCKLHDSRFVERLVDEILYFHSVGMVTGTEVVLLRDELLALVDYMEEIAAKGRFADTGNEMAFYVSPLQLETECLLYGSRDMTLSMVKILERNAISSYDSKVFARFTNMVQSITRSSALMSASNSLQRTGFFTRQRATISSMI
ncbi:MAG: hypothetical protein LBH06_01345 [Rikenellaceae bacterium]|jgi:hypothetical protein|nr:hypothetical protein [Rikenellaceae bacterium]